MIILTVLPMIKFIDFKQQIVQDKQKVSKRKISSIYLLFKKNTSSSQIIQCGVILVCMLPKFIKLFASL